MELCQGRKVPSFLWNGPSATTRQNTDEPRAKTRLRLPSITNKVELVGDRSVKLLISHSCAVCFAVRPGAFC
jgi:hypothetical protein